MQKLILLYQNDQWHVEKNLCIICCVILSTLLSGKWSVEYVVCTVRWQARSVCCVAGMMKFDQVNEFENGSHDMESHCTSVSFASYLLCEVDNVSNKSGCSLRLHVCLRNLCYLNMVIRAVVIPNLFEKYYVINKFDSQIPWNFRNIGYLTC